MDRDKSTNRSNILKPSKDHHRRDSDFSKTASSKSMRNDIKECLSVNSKANGGFSLGDELLDRKGNTQKGVLGLTEQGFILLLACEQRRRRVLAQIR